jgi:hypothetical protein
MICDQRDALTSLKSMVGEITLKYPAKNDVTGRPRHEEYPTITVILSVTGWRKVVQLAPNRPGCRYLPLATLESQR